MLNKYNILKEAKLKSLKLTFEWYYNFIQSYPEEWLSTLAVGYMKIFDNFYGN
jgi:hypothetical protein